MGHYQFIVCYLFTCYTDKMSIPPQVAPLIHLWVDKHINLHVNRLLGCACLSGMEAFAGKTWRMEQCFHVYQVGKHLQARHGVWSIASMFVRLGSICRQDMQYEALLPCLSGWEAFVGKTCRMRHCCHVCQVGKHWQARHGVWSIASMFVRLGSICRQDMEDGALLPCLSGWEALAGKTWSICNIKISFFTLIICLSYVIINDI